MSNVLGRNGGLSSVRRILVMIRWLGSTPRLLVRDAPVPKPPCLMLAAGVVMRPVDDAALVAPLILSAELDQIAHRQPADPGRDVDVVSDQQRLAGCETQDETLVTPAFRVIREDAIDNTRVRHRQSTLLIGKGIRNFLVSRTGLGLNRTAARQKQDTDDQQYDRLPH
jgi:hypothetical protein